MQFIEGKVDNHGVMIHYIESHVETEDEKTPLVIIPGFTEDAEDYKDIIKAFEDRKCVAITLRGRGQSDAPASGYTLEDHVSDIKAVVDQLSLESFHILGYSRGVSYMIEYALGNLTKIKGMIIGDYPGMHTRLVERWVEMFIYSKSQSICRFVLTRVKKKYDSLDPWHKHQRKLILCLWVYFNTCFRGKFL